MKQTSRRSREVPPDTFSAPTSRQCWQYLALSHWVNVTGPCPRLRAGLQKKLVGGRENEAEAKNQNWGDREKYILQLCQESQITPIPTDNKRHTPLTWRRRLARRRDARRARRRFFSSSASAFSASALAHKTPCSYAFWQITCVSTLWSKQNLASCRSPGSK